MMLRKPSLSDKEKSIAAFKLANSSGDTILSAAGKSIS